MDRDAFDGLAKVLAASPNRRVVLGVLLGAAVASVLSSTSDAARRKGRANARKSRRSRERDRRVRAEAVCCASGNCTPGAGKNLGKCCYQDQDLTGRNFKGANLGQANFSRATLTGANLQGANAGKACFVDAILTGVKTNGSTNLSGAIFCRTQTNSGVDNSGCGRGTPCCPTCGEENSCDSGEVCCNGRCVPGECCGDGEQSTCDDGQVCCAGTCRDGVCCSDADCPAGATCTGGRCCNLCPSGCDFGTLEEAIAGTPAGGVIRICPGVYPARDVVIAKNLTVVGAGPGDDPTTDTILESNRFQNGLLVEGGVVTLRDLRITKGHSDLDGGGIVNSANLTLRNVTVIDNTADDNGGGIANQGTLTLEAGTLVTENRATFQGGGIYQESGATTMQVGSQVTGNETGTGHLLEKGGGIYVESGTVTVANDTIVTGNTPDNCRPTGAVANCID